MMLFDHLHLDRTLHPSMLALLDAFCLILTAALPVHFWIIQPLTKLEQSHKHKKDILLNALDQASDCVMICNQQGNVEYVNRAFTQISGYEPKDILGKNPRFLQSGRHKKAFYHAMWQTIDATGSWCGEVWNRHQQGHEYLETLHIKKIQDEVQDNPYYVAIIADITQEESKKEKLEETKRLAAIGTLVGGIAHNFNNLLSGIIGNAYLGQHHDNPPDTNKRLKLIERISFDASEIVKSLLIFARNHEPKKKNIAIIPMLHHAIQTAKLGLPDDVILHVTLPEESLMLYCDAVEIQHTILSLISNAYDALPQQGERTIHITVGKEYWSACSQEKQQAPCSAWMLQIIIEDSGCGISDDVLPHIFEPFYTTKEVGKGTGLGLSTTFSIVQAHGGSIHVESTPNQGTRFELCFPLSMSKQEAEQQNGTPIKATEAAHILIVDDELLVQNTLKQILESLGYSTGIASHGQEAIEYVQQAKSSVDLIISDVVMPVLDGISAVQIIRQERPNMPAIFITGYDERLDDITPDEQTLCFNKPFDIQKLSQNIHQLLHTQP